MKKYKLTLKSYTAGHDFEEYVSAYNREEALTKILTSEMSDWYSREDIDRNLERIDDNRVDRKRSMPEAVNQFDLKSNIRELYKNGGMKEVAEAIKTGFTIGKITNLIYYLVKGVKEYRE